MVDEHDWKLSASSPDKWASSLWNYLAMERLLLSVLLTFAIAFLQGIYNYVPETTVFPGQSMYCYSYSVITTYCTYM
jgi:hypothetical protein